jgi:hypothetical protein
VSDQDDPDVIEQAPRHGSIPRVPWIPTAKKPAVFATVVVASVLLAVAGTFAALRLTSSVPADPALAGIDFANQAAQTGSGMLPNLIAGRTWQQLAAALRQPRTLLGATLLSEADALTAELCGLTGGRPAAACPRSDR